MTTYGPFVDAVPRTLIRSQQANQIIDLLQGATADTVLTGMGPGTVAFAPFGAGVLAPALLHLGGGESLWPESVAYDISSARGSLAAPVTDDRPNIKVSRIENISAATMPNPSQNQQNAAVFAISQGLGTSAVQANAVMAHALGGGATVGADVCAVNAQAYLNTPGSGNIAVGVYAHAQRDVATGRANGLEVRVANQTATPSTYDPLGIPHSMGIWVNAGGLAPSAAAVVLANYTGQTFQAGYAVHGTNPVTGASFIDSGNAAVSLDIQGSHIYGIQTTAAAFSTSGALRMANGHYVMGKSGDGTADWVCVGTAGDVLRVGGAAPTLDLRTAAASRWTIDAAGHLAPSQDALQDLGSASFRLRSVTTTSLTAPVLYATNINLGLRIYGDFSAATHSSRTLVQTSVANGMTALGVVPNGTGTTSSLNLYNAADPSAASMAQVAVTSGAMLVSASRQGAGAYLPMQFTTSAFTRLSLEANGDIVMAAAALATTDTAGHLHLPSCAGPPTGVPGSYAGRVPMVVDTATGTGRVYFRIGGTWRYAALT